MNKKNTQKKGMSKRKMIAVGAGVAAGAAAVGAGTYYFMGPKKKEHQKKAKMLMAKIKKEAIKKGKAAKKLGVPIYHQAVDTLAATYSKQYKAHEKDIQALAKKLKSEWKGAARKAVKKSVGSLKKTIKTAKKRA